MKIVNNLTNINPVYGQFYNYNRILRDFKDWPLGLRSEDMWPAACYLHGIYDVPNITDLTIAFGLVESIFLNLKKLKIDMKKSMLFTVIINFNFNVPIS